LRAYGSPNYIQPYQLSDLEAILTQTLHGFRPDMSYDLPRAHYILSFGSALLDGWVTLLDCSGFSGMAPGIPSRKGQSDPDRYHGYNDRFPSRYEWIAIKPDTEGVLALGLAQVMIENGWIDREFIRSRISGLKELKGCWIKIILPIKWLEKQPSTGKRSSGWPRFLLRQTALGPLGERQRRIAGFSLFEPRPFIF